MPTEFNAEDVRDNQINKATITIDPTQGLVITGIKVTEGLVEEVYVKSANVVGTYGTDYGYAFGQFGTSADYFETISSDPHNYGS